MKAIKKTKEYTIFEKRSGRFAVKNDKKKWVNGDDKVRILVEEKLLKVTLPAPKEEPAPEETETAETAEAAAETPAEETKVEAAPAEETKEEPKAEEAPAAEAKKEEKAAE